MVKVPKDTGSAAAPLGRRARKALAVRQSLFNAGLAAFDRQPIGLVSVLDITEKADVAKGVFYLQFHSKDEYLLALWEEVQGRFLEAARTKAAACRSETARLTATVAALLSFARQAPPTARFWLRMSSFFPDEIGEPGHLTRIRQAYLRQLAAVITGPTVTDAEDHGLRPALIIDTLGWAVIGAGIHDGVSLPEEERLITSILAALTRSRK